MQSALPSTANHRRQRPAWETPQPTQAWSSHPSQWSKYNAYSQLLGVTSTHSCESHHGLYSLTDSTRRYGTAAATYHQDASGRLSEVPPTPAFANTSTTSCYEMQCLASGAGSQVIDSRSRPASASHCAAQPHQWDAALHPAWAPDVAGISMSAPPNRHSWAKQLHCNVFAHGAAISMASAQAASGSDSPSPASVPSWGPCGAVRLVPCAQVWVPSYGAKGYGPAAMPPPILVALPGCNDHCDPYRATDKAAAGPWYRAAMAAPITGESVPASSRLATACVRDVSETSPTHRPPQSVLQVVLTPHSDRRRHASATPRRQSIPEQHARGRVAVENIRSADSHAAEQIRQTASPPRNMVGPVLSTHFQGSTVDPLSSAPVTTSGQGHGMPAGGGNGRGQLPLPSNDFITASPRPVPPLPSDLADFDWNDMPGASVSLTPRGPALLLSPHRQPEPTTLSQWHGFSARSIDSDSVPQAMCGNDIALDARDLLDSPPALPARRRHLTSINYASSPHASGLSDTSTSTSIPQLSPRAPLQQGGTARPRDRSYSTQSGSSMSVGNGPADDASRQLGSTVVASRTAKPGADDTTVSCGTPATISASGRQNQRISILPAGPSSSARPPDRAADYIVSKRLHPWGLQLRRLCKACTCLQSP